VKWKCTLQLCRGQKGGGRGGLTGKKKRKTSKVAFLTFFPSLYRCEPLLTSSSIQVGRSCSRSAQKDERARLPFLLRDVNPKKPSAIVLSALPIFVLAPSPTPFTPTPPPSIPSPPFYKGSSPPSRTPHQRAFVDRSSGVFAASAGQETQEGR
jgi:hypothetical protein